MPWLLWPDGGADRIPSILCIGGSCQAACVSSILRVLQGCVMLLLVLLLLLLDVLCAGVHVGSLQ
jgi:hypothetical protein